MRKILITAIMLPMLLLSAMACKKYYSCRCATTVKFTNSNGIFRSKTVKIDKKLSKDQAAAVCKHEEAAINATHTNYVTFNGSFTSTAKPSTDCIVE